MGFLLSLQITADCGKDGTDNYKAFHERSLLAIVSRDYIGDFDTSTAAVAATKPITPPVPTVSNSTVIGWPLYLCLLILTVLFCA